jgi:hypothetical protein
MLLSDDCNVDQRSTHWVEDAEFEGVYAKRVYRSQQQYKICSSYGYFLSQVIPFLRNVKVSPLCQSNTVITFYP